MVLVTGWNIGQLLAISFPCLPVAGLWDKTIPASCQNEKIGVYLNAAGNMVTDLVLIVLPLPALYTLHLPRSEKAAVFAIFGVDSIDETHET
ncbi:hypothetical protein SCUP234_00907 [Seiridium cupressi]